MAEDLDEFISDALAKIGEARRDIEAVFRTAPTRWVVAYADDAQLDVSVHEPTNRLVLTAEAGDPAPDLRPRIAAALMTFNLMWDRTGCLRAGMADSGPVVLISDLFLPDLTVDRLDAALQRLVAEAETWRGLASGAVEGGAPDSGDYTMIRI